nr:uncharacterized protein LOC102116282 isoform X1 [Macaca fascicularis]
MAIWVVPLSVLSSGLTSLPAPLPSLLVAAQQRNKLKLQYFRSNWNHRDFLFDSSLKSWKNLESAEVYMLQKSQNHVRNERKAPFFHPDSNSPTAQRTPVSRRSGFNQSHLWASFPQMGPDCHVILGRGLFSFSHMSPSPYARLDFDRLQESECLKTSRLTQPPAELSCRSCSKQIFIDNLRALPIPMKVKENKTDIDPDFKSPV